MSTTSPAIEPSSDTSLAAASQVLALAMLLASAANYALNLILARWLDLAAFGDASLMVTAMLALTSIAVGLQLVTVKVSVGVDSLVRAQRVRTLRHIAATIGIGMAGALVIGSSWLAAVLNTASALPFVVLGCGVPWYLLLAVDRGLLQSEFRFRRLAVTYLVEAGARVGSGLFFVALGLGATGATIGLTVSFLASWASATRRLPASPASGSLPRDHAAVGPIALLLAGQVVINNGDVILSKVILDPAQAGSFAAVALVGRAIFFASWAVLQAAFPAAVAADDHDPSVARSAVVLVAGVSLGGLAVLAVAAPLVGSILFGSAVQDAGLLLPYAFATVLFALVNVMATIDVAQGRSALAAMVLGGAAVQTAAIATIATDPWSLVMVQIVVMGALLTIVGVSARKLWYKGLTPPVAVRQQSVGLQRSAS